MKVDSYKSLCSHKMSIFIDEASNEFSGKRDFSPTVHVLPRKPVCPFRRVTHIRKKIVTATTMAIQDFSVGFHKKHLAACSPPPPCPSTPADQPVSQSMTCFGKPSNGSD